MAWLLPPSRFRMKCGGASTLLFENSIMKITTCRRLENLGIGMMM
jgi:hypothetical protein